jgi:hypothetical protein
MVRQRKLTETRPAVVVIARAAFRFASRGLATLVVWAMPIAVVVLTALALTGGFNAHTGSGPMPDGDGAAFGWTQPLVVARLYYSSEYITIVKQANARGRDVLLDYNAFDSAWRAASPTAPLAIEQVHSPSPRPNTGQANSPVLRSRVVVSESSFEELRPYLEDLRSIIVEGDGSGCGRLLRSGYQAQPAEICENLSASSRDNHDGLFRARPNQAKTRSPVQF